jgi:hypothetical protein
VLGGANGKQEDLLVGGKWHAEPVDHSSADEVV